MSETVKIPVSQTAWTDITGGASTGIITNNSEHTLRYRKSASQPLATDTFGHILHPQDQFDFDLESGFKIWALGFYPDAAVALTKDFAKAALVNAMVEFDQTPNLENVGRLRVAEPFGVLENKNITSRNRNQYNEVVSGMILEYTTLVGTFQVAEEVRGTGALLPSGTINTDNGADTMNIDSSVQDFEVGMTITGQTSGATAVISSINTGTYINHHFQHGAVHLTVGTGANDYAIRQSYRRAAYVPGKTNSPALTFAQVVQKANVVQRIGLFDDDNGLFLEITETDVAFVVRSDASGSIVDTRIPQSDWNIDRLDGGSSGGPNPSGSTLDITKSQYFLCPYLWQGVGPIFFGLMVDNKLVYCHQVTTANAGSDVYIRNPSLPIRYEIRNTGVTASQTVLEEICSTVSSEGGYTLPGLEFAASSEITTRSVTNAALQPIFAVRLKNAFPAGEKNTRMARFLKAALLVESENVYFEIHHVHAPVDITATWNDVGGGSALEYSIDISAYTGRPSHPIDFDWATTAAANKALTSSVLSEFINNHSFISQNYNSTNSEMFVILARSLTVTNADVRSGLSFIEFD